MFIAASWDNLPDQFQTFVKYESFYTTKPVNIEPRVKDTGILL